MTPAAIESFGELKGRVDGHDSAIVQIREQAKEDRGEVRGVRNLVIATLASVCGGTLLILAAIVLKKTGLS
jgi:hypothetical protein